MRPKIPPAICMLLLLTLASCIDLTTVQKDYVSARNECRNRAEDRLALYAHPTTYTMSDKEKNNALLTLFSECMKEHDWKVAGPKKDASKDAAAKDTPAKPAPPATPYTPPPGYALVPVQTISPVPAATLSAPQATGMAATSGNLTPAKPLAKAAKPPAAATPAQPIPDPDNAQLEDILTK